MQVGLQIRSRLSTPFQKSLNLGHVFSCLIYMSMRINIEPNEWKTVFAALSFHLTNIVDS